jgi:hypothetical protein
MRTTLELLADGWRALVKELGLGVFQPGRGDYTRERQQFLGHLSLEVLEHELKEWEEKRGQ